MEENYILILHFIAWSFVVNTFVYFAVVLVAYFFKGTNFFITRSDKLFGASLLITIPTALCIFIEPVRVSILQAFVIFCFTASLSLFREVVIQKVVTGNKPINTVISKKQQTKKNDFLKHIKVVKRIRKKHDASKRLKCRAGWFRNTKI